MSIDPATSTGWAIFEMDMRSETVTLVEYGAVQVDKQAELIGYKMLSLRRQIAALLDRYPPEHVHIETYFFSRRTCNGSDVNELVNELFCDWVEVFDLRN